VKLEGAPEKLRALLFGASQTQTYLDADTTSAAGGIPEATEQKNYQPKNYQSKTYTNKTF